MWVALIVKTRRALWLAAQLKACATKHARTHSTERKVRHAAKPEGRAPISGARDALRESAVARPCGRSVQFTAAWERRLPTTTSALSGHCEESATEECAAVARLLGTGRWRVHLSIYVHILLPSRYIHGTRRWRVDLRKRTQSNDVIYLCASDDFRSDSSRTAKTRRTYPLLHRASM